MNDPSQEKQLAEACDKGSEDGFIVAPGVMLAAASSFGARVDLSEYY